MWLACVLDMRVCCIAILAVAVGLVLNKAGSANDLGLSMVNMISLSSGVSVVFHSWAKMETTLTSIGRIKTYEKTPQEPVVEGQVAAGWPSHGRIKFDDVSAKYEYVFCHYRW